MRSPSRQLGAYLAKAMLTLAIAGAAQAATDPSGGGRLYRPCVVCHQPSAWGSPDGAVPSLAGQQERYLERQLALFRSGARVDTEMQIVTAHPSVSSEDDINALARYLSALEPNPNPVKGSGLHLRVGQELYTHLCAACHGVTGHGEAGNRVPRLAGQSYLYLKQQIEAAAARHKDLAPPEMTSALQSMRPQEKESIADYISRLGNSDALLDSSGPEGAGKYPPPQSH
jgi:cytochrome c553